MKHLILITAAAALAAVTLPATLEASNKPLSKKTFCHNTSRTDQPPYHWHVGNDPKNDVGGPCVRTKDGRVIHQLDRVRVEPPVVEAPAPVMIQIASEEYLSLVRERDSLRDDLEAALREAAEHSQRADRTEQALYEAQRETAQARQQARRDVSAALREGEALEARYGSLVDDARANRDEAAELREDAVRLHTEAADRERGAGNPANRDCTAAVELMLQASRWNLGKARGALSRHCLGAGQ